MSESEIQRDTYINAGDRTRSAMTFDMLQGIRGDVKKQTNISNARISKLEKRKVVTTVYVSALGLFGGWLASVLRGA